MQEATSLERQRMWLSRASARADLDVLRSGELERLVAAGTERNVEAGTLLAVAGKAVEWVFVVRHGELHLTARRSAGGRHIVSIAEDLCVVGDIPLFCGDPWPFDVLAARRTDLIAVEAGDLLDLLSRSGHMAVQWIASVAKRLALTQRRQVAILTKDLRGRVATLLLEERRRNGAGAWEVRLTQQTIAELLGARRQSVARVLADFRDQGLVSAAYGVTVLDGLRRLAEIAGEPLHQIPCVVEPLRQREGPETPPAR